MATFVKYDQFVVDLAAGVHVLTTGGSQLQCVLSNTAPVVATDAILTDVTQIAYTNITEADPFDTTNVGAESPAGTWAITGTDIILNATGAVATFRYVILYNDTPAGPVDPLIGYWDYGAGGVTLASGETFTIDFTGNIFDIT